MKSTKGGLGFLLFSTLLSVGIVALALFAYRSVIDVSEDSDHTVSIVVALAFLFCYVSAFFGYFRGRRTGAVRLGVAITLYNLVMCLSAFKEIPLWLQAISLVIFLVAIAPLWKTGILGFNERNR